MRLGNQAVTTANRRGLLVGIVSALLLAGPEAAQSQGGVRREDVTFSSGDLQLSGTLFIPRSSGPVPGVVLIHGSGPAKRSSLWQFATLFAEQGVAALAYDKRGVGQSQGAEFAWRDFSFDSLARDAVAGVAFLRARPDIDTARIGLFGASQGGWVAPLAAQMAGGIKFMVLTSASVTTVADDNFFERAARLRQEGFSESEIEQVNAMHRVDLEVSRSGAGFDEFVRLWNTNRELRWFRRVYLGAEPAAPDHPYRRWYRGVMDFDPVPLLRRLDIPVIWLFGDPELDRFGPVRRSIEVLESLRASGKDYELHMFPGADHSLQVRGRDAPFRAPLAAWLRLRLGRAGDLDVR